MAKKSISDSDDTENKTSIIAKIMDHVRDDL
jgi:hypothetical protein